VCARVYVCMCARVCVYVCVCVCVCVRVFTCVSVSLRVAFDRYSIMASISYFLRLLLQGQPAVDL
jgi:hypothetical protein